MISGFVSQWSCRVTNVVNLLLRILRDSRQITGAGVEMACTARVNFFAQTMYRRRRCDTAAAHIFATAAAAAATAAAHS